MLFIRFLNELSNNNYLDFGSKWSHLSEMYNAGFPVPPAYVIPPEVMEITIKQNGIQSEINKVHLLCDYSNLKKIGDTSKKIRTLIEDADIPENITRTIVHAFTKLKAPYVAVRSSVTLEDQASTSAAGQFDSFLNVRKTELLYYIKRCWSSTYSKNILWHYRDIPNSLRRCSVIIQKMIDATNAGVAFSSYNGFSDRIIIEAVFGLGEALVSGGITPDRFIIDKKTDIFLLKKITGQSKALIRNGWIQLSEEVGKRPKLTDKEVVHLIQLIKKLEHYYGYPIDVEWAKSKRHFYIVQCRPIVKTPKKKKYINSSTYNFLWQTGFSHFFCSVYLESGYFDGDFISYHSGSQQTLFVSKKYKKILGEKALPFYTYGFKDYKKYIMKKINFYEKLFPSLLNTRINTFSNQEITTQFEQLIRFCIKIWKDYFITELHSTESIAALVDMNKDNLWKKNLECMAKLKFIQRQYLNYTMYEPSVFQPYLYEIERRLNPPQNIWSYTWQELVKGMLKSRLLPNTDRLNASIQGKFSNWKLIYGIKAELYYQQLMNISRSTKILNGDVGNSGWYLDRAVVIHHTRKYNEGELEKRIDKMKQGSVLVSGSTGPELMIACKKAGAIVTDEGGIISHAVLISRELGIPSVIGTQYATQLIQDGDWVEVNANKGIVKIIEVA